ncbi:hypothetical protein QZH41_001662 [Actinostola sp. cb2023]|nr:hypothetical protein QZH41_001662 [Actinostola sp. cb2023]
MLKKTQEENDLDWDLKIPFVRFNYLNQEHSSTGYSPFYLTFGRNPRTPVLVKDSSMPKPKTPQQWATDLAKTLKEAHDVGDEVLVYSPTRKGQVKSLHRAWAGPYIVIQCREGNTYRIKNSDNFRQRFIRHHDQLRYLHSRPLHLTKPSQADVTDDKPVHDIQPSGVPKKPTTSTNTVPPSTSLPTFGDSDDESDEDSDNGEGEPQENGEAPGGSTEPETARRSQRQRREPQRFGEIRSRLKEHHVCVHWNSRISFAASELDVPEDNNDEVDADLFWNQVCLAMVYRGFLHTGLSDVHNPFVVKPSYKFWAPWIGRHSRASEKILNTEYKKCHHDKDVAESGTRHQMNVEDVVEILEQGSVKVLKELCQKLLIADTAKQSKIDLIKKLKVQLGIPSEFVKVFSKFWGGSARDSGSIPDWFFSDIYHLFQYSFCAPYDNYDNGGWLGAACQHGVCYGIKWLVRQEGARDHVDLIRSLAHQPNFVVVDFANQVAAHGNKRYPGMFSPYDGRVLPATVENIYLAKLDKHDSSNSSSNRNNNNNNSRSNNNSSSNRNNNNNRSSNNSNNSNNSSSNRNNNNNSNNDHNSSSNRNNNNNSRSSNNSNTSSSNSSNISSSNISNNSSSSNNINTSSSSNNNSSSNNSNTSSSSSSNNNSSSNKRRRNNRKSS